MSWVWRQLGIYNTNKKSRQREQDTKKIEGYHVIVPWLEDNFYHNLGLDGIVVYVCRKELPDDQHSCAGIARSQPVCLGGSGAQICKHLCVAEKVQTQLKWNSAWVVITLLLWINIKKHISTFEYCMEQDVYQFSRFKYLVMHANGALYHSQARFCFLTSIFMINIFVSEQFFRKQFVSKMVFFAM